jgi:hypothetical protein
MKNWYYILWSDAINYTRSSMRTIGVWKTQTSVFISFFMSINIMVIIFICEKIVKTQLVSDFIFNFFKIVGIPSVSSFFSFFLLLFIPPFLINYFLIFHNKKWEKIRKKYPHYGGKLYKGYFFFSIGLPLAPLVIGKIIYEIMRFLNL